MTRYFLFLATVWFNINLLSLKGKEMLDKFLDGVISALPSVGAGLFYCLGFALVFVCGIVNAVLCLKDVLQVKTRRLVFFVTVISVFLFILAVFLVDKNFKWENKGALLLFFGIQMVIFSAFNFIPHRKTVTIEPLKDLIKDVDKKIEKEKQSKDLVEKDVNVIEDVNFSHVLNVIEKLRHYNLSKEERFEMNELKYMCLNYDDKAEPATFRQKVNEKLSALLKIMSKYNV